MYNEYCVYGFDHRQTTSTWIWCFKKNGPQSLGKNVAGVGTKIHLIMNQQGVVAVKLTGAQVHDSKPVQEMLHTLNLDSIQAFVADKAYDFKPLPHLLNSHNIHAVIPNKRNKIKPAFFDQTIYRCRHRIENMFAKLKENRRLALRVDKLDSSFIAFICLAFIKFEVC